MDELRDTQYNLPIGTDCISRQDAMELVRDVCDAIMSSCDSYYDAETGDEVYKDILEVDAILKCNKEIRIALKNMPSAPLYTEAELQTMQDMEWAQLEKMYEIGKAERKKGKWVEIEHTFFHKCSECSWLNDVDSGYAFCPRCGSYNGGEQE